MISQKRKREEVALGESFGFLMFYLSELQRTFSCFTTSCCRPILAILALLDDRNRDGKSEPFSLAGYG